MSDHHDSSGKQFPVNRPHFTADTGRRHSHSKRHSKIRHVLAIVSVMCPLSALFVYLMSLFKLPVQRTGYYHLCIVFLAAGLVALFFYLIAYANQQRRHRISEINRAERHRRQDEPLRAEREALAAKRAAEAAAAASSADNPRPPA